MANTYNFASRLLQAALSVLACAIMAALLGIHVPEVAHADTLSVASSAKSKVVSVSAKERKAYNRAVSACMDYANQPNPIVVDMSDLGLTAKQAENVWTMIHGNGELFWINCYNDSYTTRTFTLPCYHDDATIDAMRTRLEQVVAKALKRVGPAMSQATKVHMLHDYVLDRVNYADKCKTAYTALVERKGDCFGFTLAMDLLLRRAGFEVDVAFNNKLDHSWNVVKVSKKWYHVDTTWDNGYCGQRYSKVFNWKKRRCHLYLLQSDKSMKKRTVDPYTLMYIKAHAGWTCHHKCSSTKYDFKRDLNKGFYKHCSDYKHIVRSFTKAKLKYTVTGKGTVALSKVASTAKTVKLPATVKYKKVKYKVSGIAARAFAGANATKLIVKSATLKKASVKDSLVGSNVKTVKLSGKAAKKRKAYQACFSSANCGAEASVS